MTLAYSFRDRKAQLTFDDLIDDLRELMGRFPDKRTGNNIKYSMEDIASAAFSVFFTQSPSFLAYQTAMTETHGNSNAQTLFGMRRFPTDNYIRYLLDAVPPQQVFLMLERIFTALHERGCLQALRTFDGQLLIALDGIQYHQSNSIRYKHCTVTKRSNGQISYAHSPVIAPVIVRPATAAYCPWNLSLSRHRMATKKQDCENAADKRWISQYADHYRELGVTLLGDDLYSRQPSCEHALAAGLNFIFVCKPSSHQTLYSWRWLDGLSATQALHTLT